MNLKKIKITQNQLNVIKENKRLLMEDYGPGEPTLPKHIITAIQLDKTSLGNHPAFPPDDENKFVIRLLLNSYSWIKNNLIKNFPDIDINDETLLKKTLSELLKRCYEIENPLKNQLEFIVMNIIKKMFDIDKNDVDLTIEMVDKIQNVDLKTPLKPESVEDVVFNGIEDIRGVNDEIYKRRMINCIMQGIANRIINLNEYYIKDIFKISDELLPLYKKILALNEYILYLEDANILNENEVTNGSISEVIVKTYDKSVVNVKGINFLSLLYETIRAILDLISFNGLPEDKSKATYIIKKSDFRLASKWDERFGIPLWYKIENQLPKNLRVDVIPYLFYEIVTKPVEKFNDLLINVFADTKKGSIELMSLYDGIQYNLDKENFDNEIDEKRKSLSDDNKYFNIDEL